jgi:adenine-specific DNA-methyltransferase
MYDVKKTIRYMGNKNRLLDFIIPEINKITKKDEVVCDLMAGTNSVAYALKKKYTVYTNDIQYYSFIIGKALIENNQFHISKDSAIDKLQHDYELNKEKRMFNFFEKNYSNTYFSEEQCCEIDSIRYAISKESNEYLNALYLTSLMYAMNLCQSTSGHFAQYLPSNHKRLINIVNRSIWEEFLKKCDDFEDIVFNKTKNICFNMDYKDLVETDEFKKVSCVYIDIPYTGEQYSRFYHILETVCKYDNPELEFKGLYRTDRYMSNFSLRANVKKEFDYMISKMAEKNKKLVLSYSNKGLVEPYELERIISKYYKHCKVKEVSYNHSTQGKGIVSLNEMLFVAYN